MKKLEKTIPVLSILIVLIVSYMIFNPPANKHEIGYTGLLPHINAAINSITALILIVGYRLIKKGNKKGHKKSMISAFSLGTIFLILYIIYHLNAPSTPFGGQGLVKYLYYFILLTHITFAIIVAPLVLFALSFALNNQFEKHKRIVKFAFPIWLYVSITGVLVYILISPYY